MGWLSGDFSCCSQTNCSTWVCGADTHVFLHVSGFLPLLSASLRIRHKVTCINVEKNMYGFFKLPRVSDPHQSLLVNHREKSCPFFHIHNVLFKKPQYKDKIKWKQNHQSPQVLTAQIWLEVRSRLGLKGALPGPRCLSLKVCAYWLCVVVYVNGQACIKTSSPLNNWWLWSHPKPSSSLTLRYKASEPSILYVTRARGARQAELWGRGRGGTALPSHPRQPPRLPLTPVLRGSHLIFTQW